MKKKKFSLLFLRFLFSNHRKRFSPYCFLKCPLFSWVQFLLIRLVTVGGTSFVFFLFFYSGFSFDLHSGRVKNESRIFWFLVSYSFGLTSCGHATTDVLKKRCEQSHRKCGVRETVLEILMILDTRTEAERRSQALWGRRQDWTMGENYGLAKKYAWIKTEPELDQLNQVKNTVSPGFPRHFYFHSLNGWLWESFPPKFVLNICDFSSIKLVKFHIFLFWIIDYNHRCLDPLQINIHFLLKRYYSPNSKSQGLLHYYILNIGLGWF